MRLIDADALEEALREHKFDYSGQSDYFDGVVDGLMLARDDVREAPTIDAVEVVRCKDCKYYEGKNTYCANDRLATPDDYCSIGEKK